MNYKIFLFVFISCLYLMPRDYINYYRIDRVKTVKGTIKEIKIEKCYKNKNFVVIYLNEKKSNQKYRIEISPQWYYNLELLSGNNIEVTGSINKVDKVNVIITNSIVFAGEVYKFRDKYGFPLWRGQRKSGQRNGKGKMRRRGRH